MVPPTSAIIKMAAIIGALDAVSQMMSMHMASSTSNITDVGRATTLIAKRAHVKGSTFARGARMSNGIGVRDPGVMQGILAFGEESLGHRNVSYLVHVGHFGAGFHLQFPYRGN